MTGRALLRDAAFLAALSLPFSAFATTITIVNVDAPGVGFNDPTPRAPVGGNNGTTLGEQRLNVFTFAANIWAQRIDTPVDVKVRAHFEALPCDSTVATLGAAGTRSVFTDFKGAPLANTWYSGALANKLAGEDVGPPCGFGGFPACSEPGISDTGEDIAARFTTALDDGSCAISLKLYYGLDGSPTAGTVDFATTVTHELAHGLGFMTFVDRDTAAKFYGLDDAYMVHLYDATAGKTWDQMTDAERLTSRVNTSNLLWNGSAVTAVASSRLSSGVGVGGRAQMYAPNSFAPGSSVSHWDTALYPNEVMEPSLRSGAQLIITDELLKDLGWGLASGAQFILPSSARAPGKGGAFYTTSLSIGNRGSAEARYTMKFLGHDTDGTAGQTSSEFVLGSNQSVTYEDILGSVFNLASPAYGAVQVSSTVSTLSVVGQTATPDSTKPGGTFGQSVPAFGASDLIPSGVIRSIVGIREDTSFRTNLILTNGSTSPVTINGTLLSTSGAVLGSKSWTLPALGMTQDGPIAPNMGAMGTVRDAQLLLSTSTTGGSFAAYAALIDNITNDPRTLLPK